MVKEKTHRLSLELSDATWNALTDVTSKSGVTTKVDAVRKGLSLLSLYCDIMDEGGSFFVKHEDGREERLRIL